MPMEEALVARLTAVPAISDVVETRVSWFERPRDGGFPAITISEIVPGRQWTQDGPDGLDDARVQIDCWSLKASGAEALARLVLAEMEQTDPVTASGWIFHPASLEVRIRDVERIDGGTDVYRVGLDLGFYHSST